MNSASQRLVALVLAAACLGLAPIVGVTQEAQPTQRLLLFRDRVVVGPDGNGIKAAQFETRVGGPEVGYVRVIDSACRDSGTCAPLPQSLGIDLNGTRVFQSADLAAVRVQVSLNAVGGGSNQILISASGSPGTAARISVLATTAGGLSVLPWAVIDAQTGTTLSVHNVGPAALSFRLFFFNPDGSLAGRSGPRALATHATENLDLSQVVASARLRWSRGAVHVQWASSGSTRVSTVATEVHRETDPAGVPRVVRTRELALDDFGPAPVAGLSSSE